jgi:type II secretory pathway pseudopilin PulG
MESPGQFACRRQEIFANFMKQHRYFERGQTLIETMVAIFVLVMGITAALGLATFSLHSSTNVAKQLIGMGLAREGIEAVKNMRDTNWLKDTLDPSGCYDYVASSPNAAPCYPNWLSPSNGYDIDPSSGSRSYYLNWDSSSEPHWFLTRGKSAANGLLYDINRVQGLGYYLGYGDEIGGYTDEPGTEYFREIVLEKEDVAPYDADPLYFRLKAESRVWWEDKECPLSPTWPGPGKCSIRLTIFLTNWKNY